MPSHSRLRRPMLRIGLSLGAVAVCVGITFAVPRIARLFPGTFLYPRNDTLTQVGLAFKMYANESLEMWPPMADVPGVFRPDMTGFRDYLEGASDAVDLVDYVTGTQDTEVCYVGYMLLNDEMGIALLDHYEALGPKAIRTIDIDLGDAIVPLRRGDSTSTILRLRKGIERYLVTDINGAAAGNFAQWYIPVMWEMPDTATRAGGWVLYMDGHTEWQEYPGEFPMTEPFIGRLRELMKKRDEGD